jgi:ferredoxin
MADSDSLAAPAHGVPAVAVPEAVDTDLLIVGAGPAGLYGPTEIFRSSQVTQLIGDNTLDAVEITHLKTRQARTVKAQAVIAALGFIADLGPLTEWGLQLRDRYLVVDTAMATNVPRAGGPWRAAGQSGWLIEVRADRHRHRPGARPPRQRLYGAASRRGACNAEAERDRKRRRRRPGVMCVEKVMAMEVVVDLDVCEANAVCVGIASDVFDVDDEDVLHIKQPNPPAEIAQRVQMAVRSCPKAALSIKE